MKTVMFYINTISGNGAERVIVGLANDCAKRGNRVLMVTAMRGKYEYELNSEVERIIFEEHSTNESRIVKIVRRVQCLRRSVVKFKPDLLVSFLSAQNYQSILATLGTRTKVIVSVRSDPNKEYVGRIGRFLGRHWITFADGCVFQTPDARDWFPAAFKMKGVVIPNAVGFSFLEKEHKHTLNSLGGLDLVCVARLYPDKNHRMLIDAFISIMNRHPNERLLLYGTGPTENELKQYVAENEAKDRIFFMGRSNNIEDVLSNAGIFVLPSDHEGIPNALLEAMAVGVPSISTDCPCGGPRLLIDPGKSGLLVPVGDVASMANAIETLLNDYDSALCLGARAKGDMHSFSPNHIYDSWDEYYHEVLSR